MVSLENEREAVVPKRLDRHTMGGNRVSFSGLREYKWPKRELINAVLYFVKTGCQWRHFKIDDGGTFNERYR